MLNPSFIILLYDIVYDIFCGDLIMTDYYFFWGYQATISAGGSIDVTFSNLLREIFPDKPFTLHAIEVSFDTEIAPGDRLSLDIGRNVAEVLAGTSTGNLVAGALFKFNFRKREADGQNEVKDWFIVLKKPIRFDKDDSLNFRITGYNSSANDRSAGIYVVLHIEA